MPQIRRELSWLSPKRRRTTGNLKSDGLNEKSTTTSTSKESNRTSTPDATALVRPLASHRPLSVPVGNETMADSDLFYAYARNENDASSPNYLLTFASTAVAHEWWLLVQLYFPKISRLESQQFVFPNGSGSLAAIWSHTSFSHLKSKWMYISLPDAAGGRIGGAAKDLVPTRGMLGELLDGSGQEADELLPGLRAEVREVEKTGSRNEVARLEEYFTSMMDALQRNTEKAAELAAKIQPPLNISAGEKKKQDSVPSPGSGGGSFHLDTLSTHLKHLNQSLHENSKHVEELTKRQSENEGSLRSALEAFTSRQSDDRLDIQRFAGHLDRIQTMMEEVVKERRDSARELPEKTPPTSIDISPLTQRLGKVQDAIEQNSSLMRALLEQRTDTDSRSKELNISPLIESLQKIHAAVEQQNEHSRALVGFASAENGEGMGFSAISSHETLLAPLSDHLERFYKAIEEGNQHCREFTESNESASAIQTRHLEAIRESSAAHADAVERLVESISNNPYGDIDLSPLADRLHNIHNTLSQRIPMLNDDFTTPLTQLRDLTEHNANTMQDVLNHSHKHTTSWEKMYAALTGNATQTRQLLERDKEHETRIVAQNGQMRELTSGQRELVEVVRQLTRSLTEVSNGNTCGHVVVPPPRKMNRKLVGFVYDAKDGRG